MNDQVSNEVTKLPLIKRKEFNPLDSAFACISFIIMQLVFDIVYGNLPNVIRQTFVVALLASFLVEAIFILAVLLTTKSRKVEFFNATTLNKKVDFISILVAIGMSLICLVTFTGLTNVFVSFLEKLGYQSNASLSVPNFETYLLYVFLICICPAIFEDVLFRGCILNGLKKLGTTKAVLISALIFMLMHGGPDQTIHQFVLGIVLGYALVSSGSVWVPITIHFVNNFIALTSAYLTRNMEVGEASNVSWAQLGISFVYSIVMASIGAMLIYYCIKYLKKRREQQEKLNIEEKASDATKEIDESVNNNESNSLTKSIELSAKEKQEKTYTKLLFAVSGIYLVASWVLTLISGLI